MSLQEQQGFIYERDNIKQTNEHICQGVKYTTISDSNLYNYQAGNIMFDGRSLGSTSSGSSCMFELNQSYLTVPFGCVLKIDSADTSIGTKTGSNYTFDQRAVEAISVKNFQHLFDNIKIQLGGKAVLNGTSNHNIFLTEKLKSLPEDKLKMISDFTNLTWDSSESYSADVTSPVLEKNNQTISLKSDFLNSSVNRGHLDRMKKSNRNFIDQKSGLYKLYSGNTFNNSHESGLIGVYDISGNLVSTGTSTNPITTLVFQYLVHVPLCLISDFFASFPSVVLLPNLNFTFNTNLSRNSTWGVEYGAVDATTGIFPETAVTSSATLSNACPFMVSQLFSSEIVEAVTSPVYGVDVDFTNKTVTPAKSQYLSSRVRGLPIWVKTPATTKPKLSVTPFIGYYTPQSLPSTLLTVNNLLTPIMPCQLRLCTVTYAPQVVQSIMNNPNKMILYNQFQCDTSLRERPSGSHCDTTLYLSLSRLRKLYVIPYFSESMKNTAVSPRMSLISSCPNTSSFCRLTNVSVELGSVKVYSDPHTTLEDHFIHTHLISQAMYNGNAFTSDMISGLVTMQDWRSCYNSYVFDLQKARSVEEDDQAPAIRVQFDIDMVPEAKYNFFIIVEYQSAATVDRFRGMFVSSETT